MLAPPPRNRPLVVCVCKMPNGVYIHLSVPTSQWLTRLAVWTVCYKRNCDVIMCLI